METQPAAREIWARKYALRDAAGHLVEQDPAETLARVARGLASAEATAEGRRYWAERFEWAVAHGAIPAGRIIANLGRLAGGTLASCAVSASLGVGPRALLQRVHDAGATLLAGAGIGYDLSPVIPRAAGGPGVGAVLRLLQASAEVVSGTAERRGAQLAVLDIGHPEIEEFVAAKADPSRLAHFNLSVAVGSEFMSALRVGRDWPLAFPAGAEALAPAAGSPTLVWRRWAPVPGALVAPSGETACRIHRWVGSRALWLALMESAWTHAEPGVLFLERAQALNPNWFRERLHATNPCGEQALPAGGTCVLGSIDLTRFVGFPFSSDAFFDFSRLAQVASVFTRMLDNAVELAGLPLALQRDELAHTRRHGMGVFGLGSALAMLGIDYLAPEAATFAARVMREVALAGWETGLALGAEKGVAPALARDQVLTRQHLADQPRLVADGWRVGDVLPGRVLAARYAGYFESLHAAAPALAEALAAQGARFTHHTSIAPTGSIALAFGNNASCGIDPSFAHAYQRRFRHEAGWQWQALQSCEALAWAACGEPGRPVPARTMGEVPLATQLAVQAACQPWVDAAISRTLHVPASTSFGQFAGVYLEAWQLGLKGCAVYRAGRGAPQSLIETLSSAGRQLVEAVGAGEGVTASGGTGQP